MSQSREESLLLSAVRNHAEGKRFRLNPDASLVERIVGAMVKRKEKSGEYYCPCRVVSGDKEKDKAIICPCTFHEEELEKDGHCHCRLYVR